MELFVGQEVLVELENSPGVDGEKTQFLEQLSGLFLHAEEEVGQVFVQIVVDIQPAWVRGQSQQHGAAAAEWFGVW